MANLLNKEKIKTYSIYRNHTYIRSKKIRNKLKGNKILLPKRLNYSQELLLILFLIREILLIFFSNKYVTIKKFIKVTDIFSIVSNLRLIFQLDVLIKLYKPKMVIFTWEGHAWERLLSSLCNNYENKIHTLASQFSIIKKNQIGFFTKLKKEYNPDYLSYTGKIPGRIIKKKIKFSKLIKLGSSKFIEKKIVNYRKKNDLLVALDTDKQNLFGLLNFCKNFALNNLNYNFVLRVHPILLTNKKLIKYINKNIYKINNIKISSSSLIKDLKTSRYVIYTDSTISISGINYGAIPLFFKNINNSNFFDKKFPKKNIITTYSDLKKILLQKNDKKMSSYFINYRDNYFEKFQIQNLKKIIKQI